MKNINIKALGLAVLSTIGLGVFIPVLSYILDIIAKTWIGCIVFLIAVVILIVNCIKQFYDNFNN